MDSGPLDSDSVLENSDFESFLHGGNDIGGPEFDSNVNSDGDGPETGAG